MIILWILCIMGWFLVGLSVYFLYSLNKSWAQDYNLLFKYYKDMVAKYNDAAFKYNALLANQIVHSSDTKEVIGKKSMLN